jgi:hypothetical protein
MSKINVFIIYSREDLEFLHELEKHLAVHVKNGLIHIENDQKLIAGDEWEEKIKYNLRKADIVLLLISADFFNSKYIADVEFDIALERHSKQEAKLIPILLRACRWEAHKEIKKLQVLPKDAMAITRWQDRDSAWEHVIDSIEGAISELVEQREVIAWQQAQEMHSITAIEVYINQYPQGKNLSTAKDLLNTLQAEKALEIDNTAWAKAKIGIEKALKSYLQTQPNGKFIDYAQGILQYCQLQYGTLQGLKDRFETVYNYTGFILNGLPHGQGLAKYENGDVYEGNWKDGKIHGMGIYTWPDGSFYNGEWKDGEIHGMGIYTWPDGSFYNGEWKDDARHGMGAEYDANGKLIYAGLHENGKPIKP